jgi:exosortase D (VPLPA-CTERM-specific)
MSDSAKLDLSRSIKGIESGSLLWLAVTLAGTVAFFWGGIVSLISAWAKPEYSHGPIIPLVACFLMLRDIRNKPIDADITSRKPGIFLVVTGLIVGLAGNLTQIPYFITYGLLITLAGIILTWLGTKRGLGLWVGWVYLLFMLPLPTATYWQASTSLQFISSEIGVEFIRGFGVPVFLEGNVIDLGVYKLQVAEACSGLRYLFPLASFGYLFAALYRGPIWHKVVLFLASAPITVLMNSFRIAVIGVLVDRYGTAQAEGFLHWFEGWIIFVACIAFLFLLAFLLSKLTSQRKSVASLLDLDTQGVARSARELLSVPLSPYVWYAAAMIITSGVVWQLVPERVPATIERKSFQLFPQEVNGWSGADQKLEPSIETALGADEYISTVYVSPDDNKSVSFFSAFYYSTTDGTGIHNPEICIPGGGWEVSKWQRVDAKVADQLGRPLVVNRAVIQKGNRRQLVYYWFRMRGHSFASEYRAKVQTVWDSLISARADGALVRLVTPLTDGESEASGDARLRSFLAPILDVLPQYIPD